MPDPVRDPAVPTAPILVVDDDAKIVRLVRTYLERDGFRVVTAADGPSALDAIETHEPALIVLDLMLPELDGRAVIRAVRGEDGAVARTPILVLSARSSTVDRIVGLEDGADDYLPKPFSPAELVLRVKSILRRAGSTGAPPVERAATIRYAGLTIDPGATRSAATTARPSTSRASSSARPSASRMALRRVLSRDQLLDAVYGHEAADVLDRTIDVHIRRLRDKLDDDPDAPRYVQTVRGIGYRAARIERPA